MSIAAFASSMQIVSSALRPLDAASGPGCPLATVVDTRTVFVGVGRGTIADSLDCVDMTAAGWRCMKVLRKHALQLPSRGRLTLVEVGDLGHVAHHVCEALRAAGEGDVVFFVCNDDDVQEAVWAALNVQRCPAPHTRQ
jgi:hypothetical protein